MENQKDEQEIDLIHILSVVWRQLKGFCSWVYGLAVWCLRFVYKERMYLLGALGCAVAFTLFWARPANREFQMESEIRISVLDAFYFKEGIAGLDYKCKNKDAAGLAQSLKIPFDVAEEVKQIRGYYIVDLMKDGTPDEVCYGEYEADSTKQIMKDRLELRVMVGDSSKIALVANAILRYFEENDYVTGVNKRRLVQLDDRISNLNKEVVMLDSLRKYEYFVKRGKEMKLEGPLIVTEKSQQLYYNDILSLAKQRDESTLERIVYPNALNYVRDFVMVKETNKYPRTFAYSFLAFAALALFIAFFVQNRKAIKAFLEK